MATALLIASQKPGEADAPIAAIELRLLACHGRRHYIAEFRYAGYDSQVVVAERHGSC